MTTVSFGELEAAGPLAAGGVVAAVALHEVLHRPAMIRHGRLGRQRLRERDHLAVLRRAVARCTSTCRCS
jgi:hypothetical protein